jgi:glycosyltransferase involved in cell wall biosynthesis
MTSLTRAVGFNIVGYLSGNLGLGVAARHVASLVLNKNLPLAVFDLDAGPERRGHDLSFRDYAVSCPDALPHAITIFVLSPQTIVGLTQDPTHRQLLFRRGGLKAAVLMWEHSRLPRAWRGALRTLDVIVAASHFIRSACETTLDGVLTIPAVFPLRLPNVVPSRERFQLPAGAVIFVTSFEAYGSDRKNPLAVVQAFRRCFPDDHRAMLVIRINNATAGGAPHPTVVQLREQSANDTRLRLIESPLSYGDVLTLYASCDAFVSLHRSEGLGLGPMEAMALGRPVIATAWSGNMTYMDTTNSCLVGYRLVPMKTTLDVYSKRVLGRGVLWADADIDDAATWMMRLVEEPSLRFRIGSRAAEAMAVREREAERGTFLDELSAIHESVATLPSFRGKKTYVAEYERQLRRNDARRAVWSPIERLLNRHVLWRIRRRLNRG